MKKILLILAAILTGTALTLSAQIPGKEFKQLQATHIELKPLQPIVGETVPVTDSTIVLQEEQTATAAVSDLQIRDLLLVIVRITKIFVWFVGALLFFTVMTFIKEMSDYFHRCKRQKEKGSARPAKPTESCECTRKKKHRKNPGRKGGHGKGYRLNLRDEDFDRAASRAEITDEDADRICNFIKKK